MSQSHCMCPGSPLSCASCMLPRDTIHSNSARSLTKKMLRRASMLAMPFVTRWMRSKSGIGSASQMYPP